MAKKQPPGFNTPFSKIRPPASRKASSARRKEQPETRGAPAPVSNQAQDDAALFLAAVAGARPVDASGSRVEPVKRSTPTRPDDEALAVAELHAVVHGDAPFRVEATDDELSGAAPGVSFELMRQLRHGEFPHRRQLDLHGFTKDDAKDVLMSFVADARRSGERCVLVITGKGKSSPGGVAVLREALPDWLARFPLRPHVLAFCTARSEHGGAGAFYVLLRRVGARPGGNP